jgi:ribosome-associated protein
MAIENVVLETEAIKLAQFLKYVNAVSSGGEARYLLGNGLVKVNGMIERRRGRKLKSDDIVEIEGKTGFRVRTR